MHRMSVSTVLETVNKIVIGPPRAHSELISPCLLYPSDTHGKQMQMCPEQVSG